jgi:hypothetical protein
MTRTLRHSIVLLCLVALAAPGCSGWWGGDTDNGEGKSKTGAISELEAHRLLARARQQLYGRGTIDHEAAIRLADTVIRGSDSKAYVWRAYHVKATAYHMSNAITAARKAAHEGVQHVLTTEQERPSTEALSALKMLLVAYLETAVPTSGGGKSLEELRGWKTELRHRYEGGEDPDPEGAKAIDSLFEPLEAMARQYTASQERELKVQRMIRRFILAFNREDTKTILTMIRPKSALAKSVRASGMAALTSKPRTLDLITAISVRIDDKDKNSITATATCDLLSTSPTGWITEINKLGFRLVQAAKDNWLIETWTDNLRAL